MIDLTGMVAVVTGAGGRGNGAAATRLMASLGAKVVASDINEEGVNNVVASVVADGGDAIAMRCDISDEASVKALIDKAVETYGRIDILDNNAAGVAVPDAFAAASKDLLVADMDVAIWDATMATNLRGTMLMCKHVLPVMVANGGGSIINISSGTSLAGDTHHVAYACSKGGINTLTKYVATQYGADGVRCNALVLGIVTPDETPNDFIKPYTAHKLVGRLGHPRDIAQAVAYLGSPMSSYMTGQVISLDGGFFAHVPTFHH
jgi:NAD(P)-dependent dehydrogenase (short-subunit alcohol dehydrogenase family)